MAMAWQPCSRLFAKVSLRGCSAVDASTAWVCGEKGTIVRVTSGGANWQQVPPADAAAYDFRDIDAFDADTAVAMVAGQPARIYRTTDGGASWRIVLEDARKEAFFDGIAFAGDVGILFGDPIDGAFCVWATQDRGETWTPVPREQLPAPLPGEAAFAASGSCVAVTGDRGHEQFLVATGGGPRARVLRGSAKGWEARDVPLRAGAASQGGFGLAINGHGQVVVVGGDYAAPLSNDATGARSDTGGVTWRAIDGGVGGFRSAAVWVDTERVLAVGSHGTSFSSDGGRTWELASGEGFHCASVARGADGSAVVWAAGSEGRVARVAVPAPSTFSLAALFGDHMVMPPQTEVALRGRGPAGARVAVHASWGADAATLVGADGRWSASLRTSGRGGPHEVAITCARTTRTLHDVLVGDVWLASGQSNMEMSLGVHGWSHGVRDHEREEAAATLPTLRVFTVKQAAREQPSDDVEGEWVVCSPETAGTFSATGFLFARELVAAGKGPIGLVVSSWGGTVCEAWASEGGLAAFPEFAPQLAQQRRDAAHTRGDARGAFWRALDAATPGEPVAATLPERWSTGALRDFDGAVLYEREIDVPAALRGKECWLELGAIDDMDTVWVNDCFVGGIEHDGGWSTARRYSVPGVCTAAGRATLRIRVVDTGGEGGFAASPEQMRLVAANDPSSVLPLAGTWQRRIVAKLADLPPWPRGGDEPNRPAVLWNGMIAPLVPFPFTGAIWYQGEANREQAEQYSRLFPAMIRDWRRAFGSELPFYFVQIAPFGYENDRGETALLREAQAAALALPHTGMAVTLDCGDARDIHPIDKQPVGKRLAALALARHYGGGGACEGPTLQTATRRGNDVVLTFVHTDGGMQLANGGAGWEIASSDGVFAPANARIDGDDVVVAAASVQVPTQVRYAWAAVPAWSLRNGAGWLAPPFRASIP